MPFVPPPCLRPAMTDSLLFLIILIHNTWLKSTAPHKAVTCAVYGINMGWILLKTISWPILTILRLVLYSHLAHGPEMLWLHLEIVPFIICCPLITSRWLCVSHLCSSEGFAADVHLHQHRNLLSKHREPSFGKTDNNVQIHLIWRQGSSALRPSFHFELLQFDQGAHLVDHLINEFHFHHCGIISNH